MLDKINMDIVEMGLGDVDWIDLAQDSSCERGNALSGCIKCWKSIEWGQNLWPND
jgi:hypothetical protein